MKYLVKKYKKNPGSKMYKYPGSKVVKISIKKC